ncbi:MAG: hemolysin family protein [Limisphaerales bacterium]
MTFDFHELGAVAGKAVAATVIVGLNAFFVAAEFALVRVRDTQLQPLAEAGSRRAKLARNIIRHIDAYLSTSQLGITLCGLGMGALVEPLFSELLEPVFAAAGVESLETRRTAAFVVGFLVNSFVLIAIGEIAPKSLALRRSVPISLVVAHPLWLIYWGLFPFIWTLNWTAQWALTKIGIGAPSEADLAHSDEELRLMIQGAPKQGHRSTLGRDVILNALDLRRRRVREVMQPRPEIVVFATNASIEDCLKLAEETRYSRFPLCEEGDLDRTLGVLHIKDLYLHRDRSGTAADLREHARPVICVPELARLERVLQFLLERRLHLAMVVDEYGGTVGLVTLENILEELVGQIQDEFDQERPLLVRVDDKTWDVAGNLPLHDLEHLVDEPLQHPGVSSASGWITQRLGGFPKVGDSIPVGAGAFIIRVEETRGARVTRMRVTRGAAGAASP